MPPHIIEEVAFFRYRERFKLSVEQAVNEPAEEFERAFLIWELDAERDNLESKRREQEQQIRAQS